MESDSLGSIMKELKRSFATFFLLSLFMLISSSVHAQWEKVYQTYTYQFRELYFLDNDYGFVWYGGYDHFFKTNDGFDTYEVVDIPDVYSIADVAFFDTSRGYVLQSSTNFFKTTDAGNNWERVSLEYEYPIEFTSLYKKGTDTLYLAGNKLIRTTDAGGSWEEVSDYTSIYDEYENTLAIDFKNGIPQLIVSDKGVYKPIQNDTVNTFVEIPVPVDEDLPLSHNFISAFMEDSSLFILSSGRGVPGNIFKSEDYGNNWTKIKLPENWYRTLHALNKDTVFVGGDEGILLESYDGFESWNTITFDVGYSVNDVVFTENRTAYLLTNRAIYKNDIFNISTSLREEKNSRAEHIHLNQNYPNPFNPTTNITFTLDVATHIELSIYNLLGRKIEVLYRGNRSSGNHTISFDATNLAGGIYFYELKADHFVERKNMLLIK